MTAAAFTAPAVQAQALFRALLDALSRPGSPRALAPPLPTPPAGTGAGLYAAALTLVDFETPVWLAPALAGAASELRFQLGAPLVERPDAAAFALVGDGTALPPLTDFAQGEDTYPDRSTTLLIEVAGLEPDGPWRLTGPGIAGEVRLAVDGLPADFTEQWASNQARFPRGVDVFLFTGASVVGLPRTTRIDEG